MVIEHDNKVSVKQVRKMLTFDLFSISGLLIPYMAVSTAGRDGLLCIIGGTILALIYGIVIVWFSEKIQGDFIDYADKNVGKVLTFIFYLLYIIKIFITLVFTIILIGSIVRDTFLEDTSYQIIIGILLAVCAYTAFRGIEVRARVIEFFFYIVLGPIVILLLLGLNGVDINNLAPLLTHSALKITSGSYYVFLAYTAIELFIFIPAFIVKPYDMKVKLHRPIGFVGLLNILIYIVVVGSIGVTGSTKKIWPTVTVMQMLKMPGGLVKRQDGIMLSLWILGAFTFLTMLIFFLSFLTNKMLKRKDYQYFIIPFTIIAFFAASVKVDIKTIFYYYGLYMSCIGVPQSLIIPGFVVLIGAIRKKGKKEEEKANE